MKKTCLVLVAMLLSVVVVSAQERDSLSKKEMRKEARKMEQVVLAQEALNAITARRFVVEADRLSFNGSAVSVNERTNFISLDGDQAIVQLSPRRPIMGPNGIGGITVDGTASNVKIKTDEKGTTNISMSVQGAAISAQVSISVPKNGNRAVASIISNFHGFRITLKGVVSPFDQSTVFKGNPLFK